MNTFDIVVIIMLIIMGVMLIIVNITGTMNAKLFNKNDKVKKGDYNYVEPFVINVMGVAGIIATIVLLIVVRT